MKFDFQSITMWGNVIIDVFHRKQTCKHLFDFIDLGMKQFAHIAFFAAEVEIECFFCNFQVV